MEENDKDVLVGDTPNSSAGVEPSVPGSIAPSQRDGAAIRTEITSCIVELTQPAACPAEWPFLGPSPNFRQLTCDRRDVMHTLLEKFREEELLESGVLRRHIDIGIQLSHVFGDKSSKFLIEYDMKNQPVDVISARGMLSRLGPPWLRHALARKTKNFRTIMVLVSNDDDLYVFRRLKITCISAAGLDRLSREHVFQLFGESSLYSTQREYALTLPGWQIADMIKKPSQIAQQQLEHLWRVEQVYGFKPTRCFEVWCPSDSDFEELRSARAFADAQQVSRILWSSLESPGSTPADCWNKIMDDADVDLPTARVRLMCAISKSRDFPRRQEIIVELERYRRAYESSVTSKLYGAVAATSDPLQNLQLMALGDLAKHLSETHELVTVAQQIRDGNPSSYRGVLSQDQLDERLRLVNEAAKVLRAMERPV